MAPAVRGGGRGGVGPAPPPAVTCWYGPGDSVIDSSAERDWDAVVAASPQPAATSETTQKMRSLRTPPSSTSIDPPRGLAPLVPDRLATTSHRSRSYPLDLRGHARARAAASASVSESSTAAPNTSPVVPPRRTAAHRPTITVPTAAAMTIVANVTPALTTPIGAARTDAPTHKRHPTARVHV